jgi:hypothetical protein
MVEVVERNIQALLARRRAEECSLSWQEKLADLITRFSAKDVRPEKVLETMEETEKEFQG